MRPSLALELRGVPLDVGGSTFEIRTLTLAASDQTFASVLVAARSLFVTVGRSKMPFYAHADGPSLIPDPDSSTAQSFLIETNSTSPTFDENSARLPFAHDAFDGCDRLGVALSLSYFGYLCL